MDKPPEISLRAFNDAEILEFKSLLMQKLLIYTTLPNGQEVVVWDLAYVRPDQRGNESAVAAAKSNISKFLDMAGVGYVRKTSKLKQTADHPTQMIRKRIRFFKSEEVAIILGKLQLHSGDVYDYNAGTYLPLEELNTSPDEA